MLIEVKRSGDDDPIAVKKVAFGWGRAKPTISVKGSKSKAAHATVLHRPHDHAIRQREGRILDYSTGSKRFCAPDTTASARNRVKGFTRHSYRGPWKLIYYEAYTQEADALGREEYLKSGSGRKFLKRQLKHYFSKHPLRLTA
jgi:integrase